MQYPSFSRLLLKEVGFQAGQHEILSEALSTTIYKQVKEKVKNLQKMTEKYKSEAKKLGEELDKSTRALDRSKQKYRTAYITWESANNSYAEVQKIFHLNTKISPSKRKLSPDCEK